MPLFKLLPGYESRGQDTANLLSENGMIRLNVGDGNKERKPGKQHLDVPQMLLALLKLKELVSDDFPSKSREIDMYIANIVMIHC